MPAGLALCAASCVCQYCAKSHREQGNVADAKTLEKTSRIFTDVGIGVLAVGTGSLIAGYVGAHCGGTPSTN
ncbi:MAG: hypothetical protein IKE41_02010 [Clostridia bacterium]|nr:hypothetical protein [Clostridia bacterium]